MLLSSFFMPLLGRSHPRQLPFLLTRFRTQFPPFVKQRQKFGKQTKNTRNRYDLRCSMVETTELESVTSRV